MGNNLDNFQLHRFTRSENIAKSFREGYFFYSHCTLTRTKWNVAIFISGGIRCVAPRSCTIHIRITAVVPCCHDTPVRKVCIHRCSGNCRSQRPQATRSSTVCHAQCSPVLSSYLSRFTFWTKYTFTR